MLPALLGRAQRRQHDYLYWEFHEDGFKQAIRVGDWKGVKLAPGNSIELYDLKNDIGETRNLASQRPNLADRLERRMRAARVNSPDWPVRP